MTNLLIGIAIGFLAGALVSYYFSDAYQERKFRKKKSPLGFKGR